MRSRQIKFGRWRMVGLRSGLIAVPKSARERSADARSVARQQRRQQRPGPKKIATAVHSSLDSLGYYNVMPGPLRTPRQYCETPFMSKPHSYTYRDAGV